MKVFRILLLVPLVPLLSGWLKYYQGPKDGVELTLQNHSGGPLLGHYYPGAEICTKPENLGDLKSERVFKVVPAKVATISMQWLGSNTSAARWCIVAFSFQPANGFAYRARLRKDDQKCYLEFTRRDLASNLETEAEFVPRSYRTPLFAKQGFCAALTAEESAKLQAAAQ